jgi:hypothetical protein
MQTRNTNAQAFDFLPGRWHVENRRLCAPLGGSDEWEEFEATQLAQRLPAGIGNYDDFVAPNWRPGFVGMSLRLYNPQTDMWSIYWLSNTNGGLDNKGLLGAPVVGCFRDGVGVFETEEQMQGRTVRVRYTWSDITTDSARWTQAFSFDGGESWQDNWYMRMNRLAD